MPTKEAQNKLPIFKKRFNELRGEKSQADFALFLGLSRPTIGFYENGDRLPDALTLKKISEKCNVPSDWLLGLTDSKQRENIDISKRLGLSDKAIQNIFYARNDEPRNKFKRMPILNSLLETWPFFSLLSRIAQFIIVNEYAVKELALLDADEFNNLAEIASLQKEAYKISGISEEITWNVSPHDILLFKLHNQFEGIINEVT